MKLLALTAALLLWYSVACAQGYGSYDLKRILNVSETPTGKEYRMDVNYLDRILDDLAAHAGNYPPRFDSVEDRNRAERDVGGLSAMLLGVLNPATGENPNPEIL